MRRDIGCHPIDHEMSRRSFLAGTAAGTAVSLGAILHPAAAETLRKQHKHILQVFLHGGVSQLETWDPKPGTRYGGPFQAIPTSVPGMHISELLPETARQMHHLSLVRGINSKINVHSQARLYMEKGRRAGEYPYVGSVASKYLAPKNSGMPGYVAVGGGGDTAAFLGSRHNALALDGTSPPDNLKRPDGLTALADDRRNALRLHLNHRFAGSRRKASVDAYNTTFDQAEQLMGRRKVFVAEPDPKDLERYGTHEFARYCLLSRTLLEEGVTCVKLSHRNYDTHAENFNFHIEQLGEFDRPFAMLMQDLADRGMLESTLVIVYSEFGRTPRINVRYGRDHWSTAWSIALGGCGVVPGAIVGATNNEGTEVVDREVDAGHLFHTYFSALGLDTSASHDIPGRPIPIGDPAASPIEELLA